MARTQADLTATMAVPGLDFDDAELVASLSAGLAEVERELMDAVAGADPFVTEVARHLIPAGGKRTRPLLVLLGSHFGKPVTPEVVRAAVVVELTHLATLYHDDVMDEANVRRSTESANSRFGNSVAILTGDYLFARASDIVADLGPAAVRIQARTFARLVHGQIRETSGPRDADPIVHYLDVLAEKTGSLIATSARFGGMFGGAEPETVEALAEFAETFGVAFQLSDDLLDIASESDQSGKTPGTDLREGVLTLPVLYALGAGDRAGRRLAEIVRGPVTDDELHAEALTLLRASDGLLRARTTVREYADRARAQLAPLPDVPARAALETLCDFVVDRTG
ncbi:MAG TPA: polyprenyl synthetase family protein [Actinocatenispora sp.]